MSEELAVVSTTLSLEDIAFIDLILLPRAKKTNRNAKRATVLRTMLEAEIARHRAYEARRQGRAVETEAA